MKKREKILIMILIALLCGFGYYFFWFVPTDARTAALREEVESKRQGLELASQQVLVWAALSGTKQNIQGDWQTVAGQMPSVFDERDVLSCVERIISPRASEINVRFPEDEQKLKTTGIYTVEMSFYVTYSELTAIFDGFEQEGIFNRINNISCALVEEGRGSSSARPGDLAVNMSVDFLCSLPDA